MRITERGGRAVCGLSLVESNILIDVIGDDPIWAERSGRVLVGAADRAELAINPIIYAEISIGFSTEAALEKTLAVTELRRLDLPYEAAFGAGKAFVELPVYRC